MTATVRQAALRLLLLTAASWPTAAAADMHWSQQPAYIVPCAMTSLDAGRPEARWAWGDGVYHDERDRRGNHYAWTSRHWEARLLLADKGPRTLRLTGRGATSSLRLRAFWNGMDLGPQEVEDTRPPTPVAWEVPAEATRAGLNRLRFEASDTLDRGRQLSFRLDRLELSPGSPGCGPVETGRGGDAYTLAPGAVLFMPTDLPPAAVLDLEISGDAGGTLALYGSRDGGPQSRTEVTVGGVERNTVQALMGDNRANELAIVSRATGLTTVRLVGISGDQSAAAWRTSCGLWWKEWLAALALLALLAGCVVIGRRWPGSRRVLWLDSLLLLALALAIRYAYLKAYPAVDPDRFGDSFEYLQRSRYLVRGASFWSDISWHQWQTWIRPPGYYLFLAGVYRFISGSFSVLASLQAALLAGTAVAGYLAAYPLFGRGAALVAGLLLAIYPQTVISASWILSDPLSIFLTTSALACMSWLVTRPGWALALGGGGVFGIACLVRSAPLYYVPLAGLLLYLGQSRPRRKLPPLLMVGAMVLVVLPWCVRNSRIYGQPMGIDDLVVPNFLMAHPDPEILPAELEESGVYGAAEETREEYFRQLWRTNKAARLTLDSGRILGRGFLRMAASPETTLRRFGLHLRIYFQGFPRDYIRHFLDEQQGCRIVLWTDALNTIYWFTLILALVGTVPALRRRQSWFLVAWILFFVIVTNLFFYPSYMPGRYRLPVFPALAVLAGLSLSRAGGLVATRFSRRHDRAGEA